MVTLNEFQHEIPSVALKYAFFADCIENALDKIGSVFDFDLETHLTLFEKMIFQIERNPNLYQRYLSNHFNNKLIRKDDAFVLKRLLSDIEYLNKHKSDLVKTHKRLKKIIQKLKKNQLN